MLKKYLENTALRGCQIVIPLGHPQCFCWPCQSCMRSCTGALHLWDPGSWCGEETTDNAHLFWCWDFLTLVPLAGWQLPAHPSLLRLLPHTVYCLLNKPILKPLLRPSSLSRGAQTLQFSFPLENSILLQLFEKPLGNQSKGNLGVDWLTRCKEDTGEVWTESAGLWDESLPRAALPSPVGQQ